MAANHLKAIRSGNVDKTNVIGLRKALNTAARRARGYSVSMTAPRLSAGEVAQIERELAVVQPLVRGELHASGVRLLASKRYAKRLAPVQHIIDSLHGFRLVRFDRIGRSGLNCVPVYMAVGSAGSFLFRNIPWQSGGDGPEVLAS